MSPRSTGSGSGSGGVSTAVSSSSSALDGSASVFTPSSQYKDRSNVSPAAPDMSAHPAASYSNMMNSIVAANQDTYHNYRSQSLSMAAQSGLTQTLAQASVAHVSSLHQSQQPIFTQTQHQAAYQQVCPQ